MKKKMFFRLGGEDMIRLPKDIPNFIGYKSLEGHEEYHKDLKNEIEKWFKNYQKLDHINQHIKENYPGFNWGNYKELPALILKKIIFSEYHIAHNINNDDWYENITHFLWEVRVSFGHPAVGIIVFENAIIYLLKNWQDGDIRFPIERRRKLIEHIHSWEEEVNRLRKRKAPDLNVFHNLIQKWVRAFPDIPQLKPIKESLTDKFVFDLVFYGGNYNSFSGSPTYNIRTKGELLNHLVKMTKGVLSGLDTSLLIEKGIIKNSDKYEYGLTKARHLKRQELLTEKFSKVEAEYISVFKNWLDNEIMFFNEIKPLFEKIPGFTNNPNSVDSTESKSRKDLSFIELFKHNEERLNKFWSLLKDKQIGALDEENNWVFNKRKGSIVACFAALEDLDYIRKSSSKASLSRTVASEIHFRGNEKLFRNDFNPDDYDEFFRLFKDFL